MSRIAPCAQWVKFLLCWSSILKDIVKFDFLIHSLIRLCTCWCEAIAGKLGMWLERCCGHAAWPAVTYTPKTCFFSAVHMKLFGVEQV
jgi:hypothetical protein